MITYVGNLGLPVAYTFAAAREPDRIRQLIGNGVLAVLVQWVVLAAAGWIVLEFAFAGKSEATHQLSLYYLFLYVPSNLFTLYANGILQGSQRLERFNIVRVVVPLAYLAGLGVIFALGKVSIAGVLSANILGNLAAMVLVTILIIPVLKEIGSGAPLISLGALWQDIRYGISAHIGNLQPFSNLRMDVLLLSILLPRHDLGLYVAALAGATLIKAQGMALGMVLMPEVARARDVLVQRSVVVRFGGLALGVGLGTALVALLWAEPLVKLVFGESFLAAAPVLRLLVVFAVISSLQRVLADGLRGLGKPIYGTMAEFASLAIGVPAIFWLTARQGATGAAIAVGLAAIAGLAVTVPGIIQVLTIAGRSGHTQEPGSERSPIPGRSD
jgi:O-antigen/teichoic acid export membrane protein